MLFRLYCRRSRIPLYIVLTRKDLVRFGKVS